MECELKTFLRENTFTDCQRKSFSAQQSRLTSLLLSLSLSLVLVLLCLLSSWLACLAFFDAVMRWKLRNTCLPACLPAIVSTSGPNWLALSRCAWPEQAQVQQVAHFVLLLSSRFRCLLHWHWHWRVCVSVKKVLRLCLLSSALASFVAVAESKSCEWLALIDHLPRIFTCILKLKLILNAIRCIDYRLSINSIQISIIIFNSFWLVFILIEFWTLLPFVCCQECFDFYINLKYIYRLSIYMIKR